MHRVRSTLATRTPQELREPAKHRPDSYQQVARVFRIMLALLALRVFWLTITGANVSVTAVGGRFVLGTGPAERICSLVPSCAGLAA